MCKLAQRCTAAGLTFERPIDRQHDARASPNHGARCASLHLYRQQPATYVRTWSNPSNSQTAHAGLCLVCAETPNVAVENEVGLCAVNRFYSQTTASKRVGLLPTVPQEALPCLFAVVVWLQGRSFPAVGVGEKRSKSFRHGWTRSIQGLVCDAREQLLKLYRRRGQLTQRRWSLRRGKRRVLRRGVRWHVRGQNCRGRGRTDRRPLGRARRRQQRRRVRRCRRRRQRRKDT